MMICCCYLLVCRRDCYYLRKYLLKLVEMIEMVAQDNYLKVLSLVMIKQVVFGRFPLDEVDGRDHVFRRDWMYCLGMLISQDWNVQIKQIAQIL